MRPNDFRNAIWRDSRPRYAQSALEGVFKTLDGFAAELVYAVPRSQGSWVSLTVGGKGRRTTVT